MINHLDWFLSTVWKMVSTVEVEPQMQTDINNMLTSSSVAVNQLAHMQVRHLAGNAAFRRGGLLDAAVLERAGALFLRRQPIGGTDLFLKGRFRKPSLWRRRIGTSSSFLAAVKPAAKGAVAPSRPPRSQQRGGLKKRKGQTPAPAQTTHKRPRPQGTLSRQVSKGKGAKMGVTATWTNKPKV